VSASAEWQTRLGIVFFEQEKKKLREQKEKNKNKKLPSTVNRQDLFSQKILIYFF
jgi:hypothetical protein